ncbi:MAG: polysaccharide deacetylase family protein [Pseudomonadota bacterium]
MDLRSTLLNALHASRLHRLLPNGTLGRGAILMLHHVRPEPVNAFLPNKGLSVTPEFLDAVLAHLTRQGFDLVDLDTAHDRLLADPAGRSGAPPFIAITLDDGYRNNRTHALPVFERYSAPHTIYVATQLSDGDACIWWEVIERALQSAESLVLPAPLAGTVSTKTAADKQRVFQRVLGVIETIHPYDVPDFVARIAEQADVDTTSVCRELVMGWDEVAEIARHPLVTIGGHTITHPRLTGLDADDARREIDTSLDVIGERIGARPRHFSYPYGSAVSAGPREFEIARDLDITTAVTTRKGVLTASSASNLTSLPRLSLNGHFQDLATVDVLVSGIPTGVANSVAKVRDLAARGMRNLAGTRA